MMQQQVEPQNNFDFSQLQQNQDFNFDFSQFPPDQSYQTPALNDLNSFAVSLNSSQAPTYGSNIAPTAPPPSTDLIKRSRDQQLAPQNTAQQEQWNGCAGTNKSTNGMTDQAEEEDEVELGRRVTEAKRDAQGKRKQIPPFVQKLSR
jgi:heat shock transcription factor